MLYVVLGTFVLGIAAGCVFAIACLRAYIRHRTNGAVDEIDRRLPPMTRWLLFEEMRIEVAKMRCPACRTRTWIHQPTCAWWRTFNEVVQRAKDRVRP